MGIRAEGGGGGRKVALRFPETHLAGGGGVDLNCRDVAHNYVSPDAR